MRALAVSVIDHCCHRQLAGSRSAGRLHVVALTGNITGFIPFVSLLSTPPPRRTPLRIRWPLHSCCSSSSGPVDWKCRTRLEGWKRLTPTPTSLVYCDLSTIKSTAPQSTSNDRSQQLLLLIKRIWVESLHKHSLAFSTVNLSRRISV